MEELLGFTTDSTMVFEPIEEATVFQVFDDIPVEAPPDDETPTPEGVPAAPVLEAKPGAGMAVLSDVRQLHESNFGAADSDPYVTAQYEKLNKQQQYDAAYEHLKRQLTQSGKLGKPVKVSAQVAEKPRVSDYWKKAADRKAAKSGVLCPRCNSKMVLRRNSYNGSKFYGCSKYPKCKGTRNV